MPAFLKPTAALPLQCLYPGSFIDVFSAEAVANGEYSQAVSLSNFPQGGATPTSLDIAFSGAPGTFTFNVVFAAKPQNGSGAFSMPDTTYQLTAANLDPATGKTVHFDIPFSNALTVAIYVSAAPSNSVNVTATFKR
jgi:hypothetical protein